MPSDSFDATRREPGPEAVTAHDRAARNMAAFALAVVCLLMAGMSAADIRLVTTVHGSPMNWNAVIGSTSPRWLLLAFALPAVMRVALWRAPWPPRFLNLM